MAKATMYFTGVLTILLLGVFGVLGNDCSTCSGSDFSSNCTSVKTKPISLKKLLRASPLYTLEVSSSFVLGVNVTTIDSVCTTLYDSSSGCGCPSAGMQAIITLTNGSTEAVSGSITQVSLGDFFVNATTLEFEDFYFGRPCLGTYLVYRCEQGANCTSDGSYDVLILSEKRSVDDICLDLAQKQACKVFPNIQFTSLPNTVQNPCFCDQ